MSVCICTTYCRNMLRGGSDTSEAAAHSVKDSANILRTKVLGHIKASPSTCDEVEAALAMSHQTASARIRELVLAGKIVDTGERRRTRSGRSARVYREEAPA